MWDSKMTQHRLLSFSWPATVLYLAVAAKYLVQYQASWEKREKRIWIFTGR